MPKFNRKGLHFFFFTEAFKTFLLRAFKDYHQPWERHWQTVNQVASSNEKMFRPNY